jgi:hypothetical protein
VLNTAINSANRTVNARAQRNGRTTLTPRRRS